MGRRDGWAWLVGGVAVGLVVWAVADFVRASEERPWAGGGRWGTGPAWAGGPVAGAAGGASAGAGSPVEPVPFHRLLPDATDDEGAAVRLDGTVLAAAGSSFWVRDLRDHVVRVECPPGVVVPRPGAAVSVLGVVALEPVAGVAPPVPLPAGVLLVRDVRVAAWPEGVVPVE